MGWGRVLIASKNRYAAPSEMFYAPLSSDAAKNLDWLRHLVRRRPLCACINDDLGGDGDWSKSAPQEIFGSGKKSLFSKWGDKITNFTGCQLL